MKKIFLILTLLLLVNGCSFKNPPNKWQYNSADSFESYKNNFYYGYDTLAQKDLNKAIEDAKKSADITTLARIYLGTCAVHISVGMDDNCSNYTEIANIQELAEEKSLDAYYSFITHSIQKQQIPLLPKRYQNFARLLNEGAIQEAIEDMHEMDSISSKLLSASLVKEKLSIKDIKKVINSASFYGYKKAGLYWLEILQKRLQNKNKEKGQKTLR